MQEVIDLLPRHEGTLRPEQTVLSCHTLTPLNCLDCIPTHTSILSPSVLLVSFFVLPSNSHPGPSLNLTPGLPMPGVSVSTLSIKDTLSHQSFLVAFPFNIFFPPFLLFIYLFFIYLLSISSLFLPLPPAPFHTCPPWIRPKPTPGPHFVPVFKGQLHTSFYVTVYEFLSPNLLLLAMLILFFPHAFSSLGCSNFISPQEGNTLLIWP